jgi:glycosyltransferase involved in cell wall biosynthesis
MVNKKNTISVIIAARDEGKMIGECLKSVAGFAGEILVIDMGSSDNTAEIAKKSGARVIKYPWRGYNYSGPRNVGSENARGDWVLYLDADERLTEELRKETKIKIKRTDNSSPISNFKSQSRYTAYAIPRRNFILGREFKHCGQWPDYAKRLYKKSEFEGWTGKLHEEPHFRGELGLLKNPMIHEKHETISEMVEKTNNWSQVEAELMFYAKHPPMNIPRFISAIAREFWLRMIKQAAFLDGPEGIIYALYQVFSRFVSYAKLWELQISQNSDVKDKN